MSHLGAIAASSAAGMAAGPGIGGLAAQWLGLAAPFLIAGGLAALAAVALATQPAAHGSATPARASFRVMTHVAPRQPAVLASAIGLGVVGAALSAAPAALIAVVIVSTIPRAMLSTVTYPLATDPGARVAWRAARRSACSTARGRSGSSSRLSWWGRSKARIAGWAISPPRSPGSWSPPGC